MAHAELVEGVVAGSDKAGSSQEPKPRTLYLMFPMESLLCTGGQ